MNRKHLPEKLCPVCGLAFSWRKRWERNWSEVRYCSERCRKNRSRTIEPAESPMPPPVAPRRR